MADISCAFEAVSAFLWTKFHAGRSLAEAQWPTADRRRGWIGGRAMDVSDMVVLAVLVALLGFVMFPTARQ